MEGDVEGVWSVLGTPRSWFWYTFCICDSPFLVLVHFLDVCPRVARPRVARPRVARPSVEGRGWVWRVCGRGCGRGVECAWDSALLVLVHFLYLRLSVLGSGALSGCVSASGASASGASASDACPRVARVREWRVSASGASASGTCPRVARPRVARVREWRVREWRVSASGG